MTQPGIEPQSPGPLANAILIWPISGVMIWTGIINKTITGLYKVYEGVKMNSENLRFYGQDFLCMVQVLVL